MSTLVGEQPAASEREPQSDQEDHATGASPPDGGSGGPAVPAGNPCPNCGAAMEPGQEWCLHCGAAAPGALERAPWRSTGLIVAVIAALGLGAAAAAVAALNQHTPAPATVTSIVAQAPVTPPPATTPTPAPTPPAATKTPLPHTPAKLPKAPTATTPAAPAPSGTSTTGSGANGESQGSAPSSGENAGSGEGSNSNQPSALLLDTDAASTYNPYNLPAASFGDPSLTIDGDHSTSWTAQVNPATAPSMAEGVMINLKSLKQLSALELTSTSRGMVVQVYGTDEKQAPTSITDPGWVPLSAPLALKKTTTRFKLRKPKQGFRYALVWISKAPTSAVGTPTAPGHVLVGEVELFPTS